jgi:hypothetical protein
MLVNNLAKAHRDVTERPIQTDLRERKPGVGAKLRVSQAIRRSDDFSELRAFGANAPEGGWMLLIAANVRDAAIPNSGKQSAADAAIGTNCFNRRFHSSEIHVELRVKIIRIA